MTSMRDEEWKPIETAPKDGSIFLAAEPGGVPIPVFIRQMEAEYSERRNWRGKVIRELINEAGSYLMGVIPKRGGVMALNLRAVHDWNPTHWQPLRLQGSQPPTPQGEAAQ